MSAAVISECGKYRYMLARGEGPRRLVFVMLNPSTADAKLDDPTIRRCKAFAATLGYNGIIVLNLYAFRATQPSDLWTQADPVGPNCDMHLNGLIRPGDDVVCAWGVNAKMDRVTEVARIIRHCGGRMVCLGTTKNGSPRHPLYVRGDQKLVEWKGVP